MKVNSTSKITTEVAELASLGNEDPIVLDAMVVDRTAGDARRTSCYTHLKIDGRALDESDSVIDAPRDRHTPFIVLFTIAERLAGSPASDYVTGLKMNLGIKDGKMCILYQAVGLTKSAIQNKNVRTGQREYNIICDTDYYFYQKESNTFERTTDITPLSEYKELITIRHNDEPGTGFTRFIEGSDIESAIFSFQEIFAVLDHNPGSDTVGICNAIEIAPEQTETSVKHALILAPDGLQITDFYNVYADLAHLCPPNCHKLIYTIR